MTPNNLTKYLADFTKNPSDANFTSLVAKLVEFKTQNQQPTNNSEPKVDSIKATPKPADDVKKLLKGLKLPQHRLDQFKLIAENLIAIGVVFEGYATTNSYCICWKVKYNSDVAGLFLTSDWSIDPIKEGGELTGDWEGFDLIDFLGNNDVDCRDW